MEVVTFVDAARPTPPGGGLQGAPERLPRGLAEVELACQLFQREAVPVRIAQGGGHRLDLDFHGEGT